MATAIMQDLRLLELTTPLGANVVVINGFAGSDGISRSFHFKLDLLADIENKSSSEVKAIDKKVKTLLGKAISLKMEYEQSPRHFHGLVGKISDQPGDLRFLRYSAEVVPWLWLLTLKSESRIFQDKNVVEVVKAVFDDLKSSFPDVSYRDATTGTHIPLDYCVQYRESDFNFVSRLMEQEGIFYFFEFTEDKHTLVLADANSVITAIDGKNQVKFIQGGIGQREGVISVWQEQVELRSSKYTFRDHHFQLPSKTLEVSDQTHDTGAPPLEFYDYPGEFALRFKNPDQRLGEVQSEGEKFARTRLDGEILPGRVFTATSTRRNLLTGRRFTLTDHPTDDGDYIVFSMEYHAAQTPDYITSEPVRGVVYQNSMACIPAETRLRPRRTVSKPVVSGPQTAVVSVKSGEESWLDKYGRVRVQFHWERQGKDNETSACWIRVAQSWAGASWGAHFWPRVGQEVVVEFLEGDPDRPIITGSVYNAANLPPYPLPDNYTRSGILTRSSRGGASKNFNELRFEDKTGSEQIFLHAEKDVDHYTKNEHRGFVGASQHLTVGGAQNVSVGGSQSNAVGQNAMEKITGKFSLQVGNQHQKVNQIYTLTAGSEIHLHSDAKIVIDGGNRVSIKVGASFIDISADGIAISGKLVNINSGGGPAEGTPAQPDDPQKPAKADSGGGTNNSPKQEKPAPSKSASNNGSNNNSNSNSNSNSSPVQSVTASGRTVTVTHADGSTETRTGNHPQRDDNPGDIKYGSFAKEHGAIGQDGPIAVFPTQQAGFQALDALLKTPRYQNKTLDEAIATYAPPSENNTAAYQAMAQKGVGVPGNTPVSSLTPSQFESLKSTIAQVEGFTQGTPKITTTPPK